MPVRVYYKNDPNQPCTIRPTPLVSTSVNILKNGAGEPYGVTFILTLTGKILNNQGTPYAYGLDSSTLYDFIGDAPTTFVGPYGTFDSTVSHFNGNKPPEQSISLNAASHAIFSKQEALRALFANDGQKLEISDFNDDEATIICYPRTINVEFPEGIYVQECDYTITLECDTLLNKDYKVDGYGSTFAGDGASRLGLIEQNILTALSGAFVRDYSDEWSIETDDSVGESTTTPRSYRISRNISAVGKTHHFSGVKYNAWEQAKKFVQLRLANSINDYPNVMGIIGSGTINLVNSYGGFNHVRSEQVSESNGTYSVSENWLIASGTAYENFAISIASSTDNPFVNVSIDGNIRGLSQISPSGTGSVRAYDNAQAKYVHISNSGQFGVNSDIYKRVNNAVAVQLNSQPKSIALGVNEYTGEVTYNLQFDNRPTNIISGVLSEDIQINDGNPGDVFAVLPVIGRPTGPILQYVGGRTEYTRDISINLVMDYTKIPYGSGRNPLVLKKPSVIEPTATQLANLIRELSPAGEPGIRKYFVRSSSENWSPKTGNYSVNLSWVYELNV